MPHQTTLSRRAKIWKTSTKGIERQHAVEPHSACGRHTGLKIDGAGQWLEDKHGAKSRHGWRQLHLAVDADSGEIIGHSLTDQEDGDVSQLEPLLDEIDDEIGQLTADGA